MTYLLKTIIYHFLLKKIEKIYMIRIVLVEKCIITGVSHFDIDR